MFVPQKARITLAAPPKAAKSRPSVSSCRTSRPRRAPIARRTEISFCRDLLRASSRLATLAQAISRTSPATRSEEHTSELQSQFHLVCRLLLEKKNKNAVGYGLLDYTLARLV